MAERAFTSVILAGGRSSRFGTNKAEVILPNGKNIMDHMTSLLLAIGSDVIVSHDPNQNYKTRLKKLADDIPDIGPLGGVLTAFKQVKTPYLLLLPCDMPLLNQDFLESFIQCFDFRSDAGVFGNREHFYPLPGIYSVGCYDPFYRGYENGMLSLKTNVLGLGKVQFISVPDDCRDLFNMNTRMDFEKVKETWV